MRLHFLLISSLLCLGVLSGWFSSAARAGFFEEDGKCLVANISRHVTGDSHHLSANVEGKLFYADAFLNDQGTLTLNFKTKQPDGTRVVGMSGRYEFQRILNHFGKRVKRISGIWVDQGTDNLDLVNQLTAQGESLLDAAKKTWTGKQALSAGFTDVKIGNADGVPGRYTSIAVIFERPVVVAP